MVIHLHFHSRTTGITKSVESILPVINKYANAKICGYGIKLPRISLLSFLRLAFARKKIVVHVHRNNETIFALLIRFLGGNFKLVYTRHAESKPSGLTTFLMKKADVLLSLTRSMSRNLPYQNTIIRHGVNTGLFTIGEKKKLDGIPQDKLVCVIGRVRPSKGQLVVLDSMADLLKINPGWGLVMIGKIDKKRYANEIISLANQNKIASQVHLIPETDEIIDFYHASEVVVIPSCSEGFSLVCLEALSCGLTTVATESVGIHSEVITHGKNGFLFPAGDSIALKNILADIINNGVNLYPEEVRQNIVDNWDLEKSVLDLLEIYGIDAIKNQVEGSVT